MTDGAQLYRPRPTLADHIAYFGYCAPGGLAAPHVSRALPRGAVTAVIDLDGRAGLDVYSCDGRTRSSVPPAFAMGAGTKSHVTTVDPNQTVVTIHFRPAGALPFLGCPLGDLEDAVVGLEDLWGSDTEQLRDELCGIQSARQRVTLIEAFLLHRMSRREHVPSPATIAAMRWAEMDPSMPVAKARAASRVSRKRFTAQFRSDVGLSPKAYFRVRRLQATLRALDAGMPGARIAADLGYVDQAHLVREFRSFTGVTPTQYAQRRSWMPSHVELVEAVGRA